MANALETLFTETANSIRGGLPDVGKMSPSVFPEKIDEIVANSKNPALQEKTVTPTTSQQEVTPDAEYDGLSKVTVEAMQVSNTVSPVIEVSDAGLIQASVQYSEGYITEDTRKTAVKQLPIKAGERVIPSTTDKVAIEAGVFTTWPVTVAGDANLVPEKIKKNESIFGILGTYEGSGGGDSSGGGGVASEANINFYDYDGTLVAAWTLDELATATALPNNPTHAGLTAQGWNWTLADLQAENRAMNVGQMYTTDDGKTRLYITIASDGRMTVPLYFSQTVANGVTIDWGDGSTTETIAGTGVVNTSHTYASIGDYVIALYPVAGCDVGLGGGVDRTGVLGGTTTTGFLYSSMLKKVEIGERVTNINYAFSGYANLASITIPNSVNEMLSCSYTCHSLTSIVIPNSVTSIQGIVFQAFKLKSISIPNSITEIPINTLSYCYSLASITIPSSVTKIGANALSVCYSLRNVDIPSGVTSIGVSAFRDCYSLENVTIGEGVTSIGEEAFYNCYNLKSFNIPNTVTSIGTYLFYNCYSLENVTIGEGVTSISAYAFYNCGCLKSIAIPNSVTSIGTYAFYKCSIAESINIFSGVTSIGVSAFRDCALLANIDIPSGVTSIGSSLFYGCKRLASITIPSSVSMIDAGAFSGCIGMKEYHLKRTTPPTLSNTSAFRSIPADCVIYVPIGCLSAYQAATNWSTYASYMQEETV